MFDIILHLLSNSLLIHLVQQQKREKSLCNGLVAKLQSVICNNVMFKNVIFQHYYIDFWLSSYTIHFAFTNYVILILLRLLQRIFFLFFFGKRGHFILWYLLHMYVTYLKWHMNVTIENYSQYWTLFTYIHYTYMTSDICGISQWDFQIVTYGPYWLV